MIIVYSYVCGDVIHYGHVVQLLNAKSLGDKLIVGVLTDHAIMEKKQKPIIEFAQRMDLIRNFKFVDAVLPQDDYSPMKNVLMIQPDILMESESHMGYDYINELKKVFKGRIIMTPYYKELSSSGIKDMIKDNWKKELEDKK